MAWIRTSLSMISFGFTIVKVFEYLATERKLPPAWFDARPHPDLPRDARAGLRGPPALADAEGAPRAGPGGAVEPGPDRGDARRHRRSVRLRQPGHSVLTIGQY
jgi:hypothetical protein